MLESRIMHLSVYFLTLFVHLAVDFLTFAIQMLG